MKQYQYTKTGTKEHLNLRIQSAKLLKEYNLLDYENSERKREVLAELMGSIGRNVSIGINFYCDSGKNIFIGDNVVAGPNCTFVDNEKLL